MIRNNDYSRMLVGVGKMLTVRYNLPDETEQGYTQMQGTGFFVADGEGSYREPTYTLGVTERPYGIVMAKCSFAQGMVHRVYGKVSPVTEKVHITGPGGFVEYYTRPGDLLKNEWTDAPVTVDSEGKWSVDVDWLVGGPKTIYAFCLRDPTATALANCKITIEGFDYEPDTEVMEELDSGVKKLALIPVEVENTTDVELNGSEIDVRVTGTCPEDAGTVYLWRFGQPKFNTFYAQIPYSFAGGSSVEMTASTAESLSTYAKKLIPGRRYRIRITYNSGKNSSKSVYLTASGTAQELVLGGGETDGFTLTLKSDKTATLALSDGSKFNDSFGLEWSQNNLRSASVDVMRISDIDKDWNAYWQQDNTVTRDPDNLCPHCHGEGCAECCHTGLELDGEFYARLISYTGVWKDEDGELHYNHEGYNLYCAGYGAVRDGRYEINTGMARLQMGDWLAVMFISEQSRDATARLEIIDSYPPCLSGDTPITMADGSTRPLRELHFGDQVLSGSGEATAVISTSRGRINPYHTLYTFDDGTVIDESADHRFYNVDLGYWAWLRDWRIGDRARRVDGSTTALVAVERVDEPAECYGLWTESRDYWAGGLLSGETMANQRLLAEATAEQAADMLASIKPEMLREMMGGEEG